MRSSYANRELSGTRSAPTLPRVSLTESNRRWMLSAMASNTDRYRSARDQVFTMPDDDPSADTFAWPRIAGTFNWATDWFDVIARDNDRTALWIVGEDN